MDGDAGFTFSASDFKASDTNDPMASWGDMFLDSIHSDEPDLEAAISDSGLGPPLGNAPQSNAGGLFQLAQGESQQIMAESLTNIPTHLQASVPNNSASNSIVHLPQHQLITTSSSINTPVTYLNPSTVTPQQKQQPQQQQAHFKSVRSIQNVLPANSNNTTQQATTASQGNTKLVQIAPSIPVATVQQLANNVPLQTLLQPNQALAAGQSLYGNQNQGLFPQGSVHIENPKVVNVNFGPHVIQQDGSGQPAIIQTAEGKRVLITNQLQGLPQSISLTQPIMGTHLINTGAASMGSVNHVIRTTMTQAGPTLVPSTNNASTPRQIVLPSGQTVIPRQPVTQQATAAGATGFSKNVVLRQINPGVQSVIYQGGQNNVASHLIQSPQALIASSGAGLQVVSAGTGNQGNQVQLIAQPSINQAAMGGQQINQNTLMNLINSQGMLQPTNANNQLPGLVSGQNILLNGQMININQLGGLAAAIPQLQVNNNTGIADTTTVAGMANRNNAGGGQFQPLTASANQQQVFISSQQQQQLLLQPKTNTPSPSSHLSSSDGSQKLIGGSIGVFQQGKTASLMGTPLHNSASSTPALTPTPSTPTPTPTPDNIFDELCGGSGGMGMEKEGNHSNILEQALKMSCIDLSIEDGGLNFLADSMTDCTTTAMDNNSVVNNNINFNSNNNNSINNNLTPVMVSTPVPIQIPAKPTTTSPAPLPTPKAKKPAKSKAKSKQQQNKQVQPLVNVTVNSNLNIRSNNNTVNTMASSNNAAQQAAMTNNAVAGGVLNVNNITNNTQQQGQKVGLGPQIITPTGQVYVLSADGQQLVLQQQQQTTTGSLSVSAKPGAGATHQSSSPLGTAAIPRPNIHIPATGQGQAQQAKHNKSSSSSSSSPADIINNRLKSQIAAVNNANQTNKSSSDNINTATTNQRMFTKAATSSSPSMSPSPATVQQQQAGSHVFVKAGMASLKSSSTVPVTSSQCLPHVSPSLSSQANFIHVKNQHISTLAGKFVKQEPLAVVKQEPPDVKPFSFFDPPLSSSGTNSTTSSKSGNTNTNNSNRTIGLSSSSQSRAPSCVVVTTSTNVLSSSQSVISGGAVITTSTTVLSSSKPSTVVTSSLHNSSIMSTAAAVAVSSSHKTTTAVMSSSGFSSSVSSRATPATAVSSSELVILTPNNTSTVANNSSQSTIPTVSSSSAFGSQGSGGKNSKSKDSANVKTLTQVKIANNTLTLSLTAFEKEKFEKEIAVMSMEKQTELLSHQKRIIQWSHDKQMKQKQQQQQQHHQHQQQQHQQQQHQQQQHQQQQQQHLQLQQQQNNNSTDVMKSNNNSNAGVGGVQPPSESSSHKLTIGGQQQQLNNTPSLAKGNSNSNSAVSGPKARKGAAAAAISALPSAASVSSASSVPAGPVVNSSLPTTIQELDEKLSETQHQQPSADIKSWQQKHHLHHQQQQQRPTVVVPPIQQQEVPPPPRASGGHVLGGIGGSSAPPHLPTPLSSQQQHQPAPQPVHSQTPQYAAYQQPMGRCLAEQQLSRDRTLALGPDTSTRFKNLSDAMRRLVRFHTLQDHKPEEGSQEMKTWDKCYGKACEKLVQRKRRFMRRYTRLMMYQDNITCENHTETLVNLRCFNENLKETLAMQKEQAIHHPESYQRFLAESQTMKTSYSSPERENSGEEVSSAPSLSEEEEEEEEHDESQEEESEEEEEEEAEDEEEEDNGEEEERSDYESNVPYQQSYYSEVSATPDVVQVKQEIKTEPLSSYSPSPQHYSSSATVSKSPSCGGVKRKHEEPAASSGTLKLVFKRRNTDHQSFTIKPSSNTDSSCVVSEDYKPVVNMDKSDSLYEFDSKTNGVSKGSSVVVKRRESSMSQVSRQTSVDNRSVVSVDSSSFMSSSYNDDMEEEFEEEEESDDNNHHHHRSQQRGGNDNASNTADSGTINNYNVTDEDEDTKFNLEKKTISDFARASAQMYDNNYKSSFDENRAKKQLRNQERHENRAAKQLRNQERQLRVLSSKTSLSSSSPPPTHPSQHPHHRNKHSTPSAYLNTSFPADTKIGVTFPVESSKSKQPQHRSHHHHNKFSSMSSSSSPSLDWARNSHVKNYNTDQFTPQQHNIDCDIKKEVRYSDISAPDTVSGNSSQGSKRSDTAMGRQLSRMQQMSTASDDVFLGGNQQDFPPSTEEEGVAMDFQREQYYHQSQKSSSQQNSSSSSAILERNLSIGSNNGGLGLRINNSPPHRQQQKQHHRPRLDRNISLDRQSPPLPSPSHSKFLPETPTRPTIPHLGSTATNAAAAAAAANDLFPTNVQLFTTPNKSLLQTDAMFNTSSEDEEDVENNFASAFKIDNRDPQSSMVSDSVQTVINSVINNDDDDDDDDIIDDDDQNQHRHHHPRRIHRPGVSRQWIRSSSSSASHSPFFPTSSLSTSSSVHHHNQDDQGLDAAVQSILNKPPSHS